MTNQLILTEQDLELIREEYRYNPEDITDDEFEVLQIFESKLMRRRWEEGAWDE